MNISLPVAIEANGINGRLGYQNLRLIPEIRNSGMGLCPRIIGGLNTGLSLAECRRHCATNYGLGGEGYNYSQILFWISCGTSWWASFGRLLLPLSVLMAKVLIVLIFL